MPSQEDYLDNLLKDMSENREEQWADTPSDLDSVSNLSEEEIEKLLSAGEEAESDFLSDASALDLPDEDVLKMLEESGDSDLQEIQELLGKSDRNEAVDDSIEDLLREVPEDEGLEARILGESEEDFSGEEKKRKAQDKKELAQEKRRQKREQAAAKRQEKKAARETLKAARTAEKEKRAAEKAASKALEKKPQPEVEEQFRADVEKSPEEDQDDGLFDMSLLDSIVSEADKAGLNTESDEEKESIEKEIFDNEAESSEKEDVGIEETFSDDFEAEDGGDDFDLGNIGDLFGAEDSADSLFDEDGASDFPDFIALDAESTDALATEAAEESIHQETSKGKKGFFSKILDFLTEEDEEDGKGNENIRLSQENSEILSELDREAGRKKGKKSKKGKKDKPKEKKPAAEKKPKKQPKPKKDKQLREVSAVPEKKLSFKKVFPILLIGVSVGVLLFVFVNSAAEYSDKRTARNAFYEGDYQTCYQNLHGKELDETESIMFGKSESILYIRLWIREYEMFVAEGDEVRALDSLIQTVADYPGLYEYANRWNAGNEVAEGYAAVLNILADKYGLTEAQVLKISAEPDDVEYTKMVIGIVNGNEMGKPGEQNEISVPEEPVGDDRQDVLPEEEGLGRDSFIDNQ